MTNKSNIPSEQQEYVFGPSRCGVILRETLLTHPDKKLLGRMAAFYSLSRRTINVIESEIKDKDCQKRIRLAYVFFRTNQLDMFCKAKSLDMDIFKRMRFLIKETIKHEPKNKQNSI